jgi:hypothetical protein
MSKVKTRLNYSAIKNSSLKGFWLRLKKLGWKLGYVTDTEYRITDSPHIYVKSLWSFKKSNTVITFSMKKHEYFMLVKCNKQLVLKTRKVGCPTWLEVPFLDYLQETQPLDIPRIGLQSKKVQKWRLKLKRLQLQERREKGLKQKKKREKLAATK